MKLYEVGCIVKEVQPKNGVKITLEETQALVGGYVELVHLDDNNILLCDEEGLLKHKPINTLATIQAKGLGWKGSYLVGSVFIFKGQGVLNMSKARKNEMNKDIPEERITLRVLENYSKMQEELCRLRKKTREQGYRLNELNNQLQRLSSKEVRCELEKYRKLLLERDELREKNKALEQVVKQYEGLKKVFYQ